MLAFQMVNIHNHVMYSKHNIDTILVDIISTKLCAVDRNDVYGACMGDSGGPLVVLEKADDHRCK